MPSQDAKNDPNFLAYQRDLSSGKLDGLMGQYVCYADGIMVASGQREDVLEQVRQKHPFKARYVTMVGETMIFDIPTPLSFEEK